MTFDQFDKFQEKLLQEVKAMRDTKGKEYANSEDRFANFNRLANVLHMPNYAIGWVYCVKHIDSIASFMVNKKTFSDESIQSRFVDTICYLTLIAGMVEENLYLHGKEGIDTETYRGIDPASIFAKPHYSGCTCIECYKRSMLYRDV